MAATALFGGTIAPELETILRTASPSDSIAVIVQTREQADLSKVPNSCGYDDKLNLLKAVAERAQRNILADLSTVRAENVHCNFLVSRISLKTTPDVIRALAQREDVESVFDDFTVKLDDPASADLTDTPGWNISKVCADSVWIEGYTGAGIVVSNIDTGVDVTHPAFGGRWRSTDGWFDAVNGQTSPYDDHGHGTHTMGTICGGDGLGPFEDDIGVAPGATFVCAKGFDSGGSGQASWIQDAFDWIANTGRPKVCSNSWGSYNRTTTEWFPYVQNLRNLGIVVVFSIGNNGGGGIGSSLPPGSYPLCISAGATSAGDTIRGFSSRGPAPDQDPWSDSSFWPRPDWNLINPSVAAPGYHVRSAQPGGGYQNMDGTSMACPHVAGAAALLLEARPNLTHDQIFNILADNADHVPAGGDTWPNNYYGWGRLNCQRAIIAAANRPNVILTRSQITEDPNGNGWLDPGEAANLIASLKNSFGAPATDLVGILRVSDPYVTVTDSLANYGTVAGLDTANNRSDPFLVSASSSCPPNHVAELSLYLVCRETSWTRTIRLVTGPPVANPGIIIWGPRHLPVMPDTAGLNGIAYNPVSDRIYVTDYRFPAIYTYSSDSALTALGSIPTPNNETACTDIKYCAYDNTFWVAAGQTKRVYKISPAGEVLRQFNNRATNVPTGLAWDEANRILYLADRRSQGVPPGYVYVTDTLGNQLRRMTVPMSGNMGPRGLALEQTNSNPERPTLLMAYTWYNSLGNRVDSSGLYELRTSDCTLLQRFLSPQRYILRGVEYDPRDASLWATVIQDGSNNNLILKYAGFHVPTAVAEEDAHRRGELAHPWGASLWCTPSPFQGSCAVSFRLAAPSYVRLGIRDAAGREIALLAQGRFGAGVHHITWNRPKGEPAHPLASGVYFASLETPQGTAYHKVIKF
jgi:subtilisin family serine protease